VSWSRRTLSERVDELADEHDGSAFVAAVKGLAGELDEKERALLGEVLLERAERRGGFDYSLLRRIDEPRWQLFPRRPQEPGRGRS
jgi:hypothetical protein